MKKLTAIGFIGLIVLGTSCKKYLDINENPNTATSATPQLILPQALTTTASSLNSYNSYGAQQVGYSANAGGYGGFGSSITYSYTTDYSGLWSTTYDNLEDYQAVYTGSLGDSTLGYFQAVAMIMKAYNFKLLVDAYNDIPYTEALKGADNLTPTYSSATAIYPSLANQLDSAITLIKATESAIGVTELGTSDVLFDADMTKWIQFANTIKLNLIITANGKATFSNTTFDDAGFLTEDALVDPGYTRDNGRQNPAWNSWAYTYTGGTGNKAWMPNTFVFGFYDGTKLEDSIRGKAMYYKFPNTGTNQLGNESSDIQSSPTGSFWYPAVVRNAASAGDTTGVLKGPDAGYPVMLATESYFLQAEAALKGVITSGSTVKDLFENGINASIRYLYQLPDGSINKSDTLSKFDSIYRADNSTSYLVNFDLASTDTRKLEAIITQKYIALNFVNSQEAWNDYRRTHYPAVVNGGDATETFASKVSESTRADKLPTRILYPTSEGSYNSTNVPKNISPFTSLIFWAQ